MSLYSFPVPKKNESATDVGAAGNNTVTSTQLNPTEIGTPVEGESQLKFEVELDANTTTAAGIANATAVQLCACMQVSSFVIMLQQVSNCTRTCRSLSDILQQQFGLCAHTFE
jgi:hypothetical protein